MTLVLLPGMDGTGRLFEQLVSAMESAYEVRVVSYPGDRALGYTELESLAIEMLPANSPYIVLGESFSGPIAVSLASAHPRGLRGIILSSSFVKNPRLPFTGLKHLPAGMIRWLLPIGLLNTVLFGRLASSSSRKRLKGVLAGVSANALAARLRAVLSVDVSESPRVLRRLQHLRE